MQEQFQQEMTPEVLEKTKKNMVYLGIFSIIMLFAGLTSAYIVSMGDTFWVKYPLPSAFYVSTTLIVLSSLSLIAAVYMSRKGSLSRTRLLLLLTFLLGIGFAVFQFYGYKGLLDKGAYLTSDILVTNGRYGDYYELKINDKYLIVDGNDYRVNGKDLTEAEKKPISAFAKQFEKADVKLPASINGLNTYTILYKGKPVSFKDGKLWVSDTTELLFTDLRRLTEWAWQLRDGRGDFFMKGKLGKDFHIYYKNAELQYKDRALYYKHKKLHAPLQLKLNQASDTATSYLYIITFLHLLHVLGALIYLLSMTVRSFTGTLVKNNYLSLRMGAIFWHFLGLLWIYLLLFLLFIH